MCDQMECKSPGETNFFYADGESKPVRGCPKDISVPEIKSTLRNRHRGRKPSMGVEDER